MLVEGEPALLLAKGERSWCGLVRACGLSGLSTLRLRFVVSSWRRRGHTFDLDNLIDPVIAVVGAPAAERRSVWATVELGEPVGVLIGDGPVPPPPPSGAVQVHLGTPPLRSIKNAERLAELAETLVVGTDGPCGCALTLGGDTGGLVFGFEGPIKPTIDALWPLLGGAAGSPHDHRIRDLRVTIDPALLGTAVAVWPET